MRVRRCLLVTLAAAAVAQPACAGARAQVITVLNDARVPARELARAERVWAWQANTQLRRWWHTPRISFGPGGWKLTLVPIASLPQGLAGLHSMTLPAGRPFALVGVDRGLLAQAGRASVAAWETDGSHELLEMLADPSGGGTEVCDPLEFHYYLHGGVGLSAFITPIGTAVGGGAPRR